MLLILFRDFNLFNFLEPRPIFRIHLFVAVKVVFLAFVLFLAVLFDSANIISRAVLLTVRGKIGLTGHVETKLRNGALLRLFPLFISHNLLRMLLIFDLFKQPDVFILTKPENLLILVLL